MRNSFHLSAQRSVVIHSLVVTLLCIGLGGCLGIPDNVKAVRNFELERYLGTWYEIARLDHRFERGLSQVSAEYSRRDDGGVRVINSGYNPEDREWERAEGKAYFVDSPDIGRLKVSFFGPFYGAYNIVALDEERYDYSMVISSNMSYLWILARQPTLDSNILAELVARASELGFNTDELIYPKHGGVKN
ncbi:MAG: apolipoprotein D and lipocalin family protein [Gammaproteobacteria bacterium]|jgi:apolipoprotein D and lipocalin family protein